MITNDSSPEFESRLDFGDMQQSINAVKAELSKGIIGQELTIELLLTALLADGHVLIEGVPGIAKTLTAKMLAKTISADFSRIQFTPDLMPSDVLGTSIFHPAAGKFEFKQGPVFSNIILIDEINRAPAKTQSALFEVMEERQVSYDGITYPMRFPFVVMATQNPVDHEGTYRLPEAQLDRFMFKLEVGYPSLIEEVKILDIHNSDTFDPVSNVKPALTPEQIANYRSLISQIHVEEKIKEYIVNIVSATRNHPFLYLGASPRASIALLNASKALAALRGKDFVVPEEIQELALPVLRHRIILSPEKEMEGLSNDEVIRQIIRKIEVPR